MALGDTGNKELRDISRRALFELDIESDHDEEPEEQEEKGEKPRQQRKGSIRHRPKDEDEDGGHVMISYNWSHQPTALKIKEDLERSGYKVWIDVDKMG